MSTLIRAPLAALDANVSTRATPAQIVAAGLDAAVSSRASAANYTAARAGYLDNLNTGQIPVRKAPQEGYVATGTLSVGGGEDLRYKDVTISAVNVARAVVRISGLVTFADYQGADMLTARITSPTNLRISIPRADVSAINVRWVVEENNA